MYILLVALNYLDLALTKKVIALGAAELNPVAGWMGDWKMVLIVAAGWAVWRLRPGAIRWLCGVYAAVVVYQVGGLIWLS